VTDRVVEADVVIVGAGSAGCVLANRLSADTALRVILIEAGTEATDPRIADPAAWPMLQGTGVDWAFATTPQPGLARRVHPWPRGRVVGGSSAIHAMGHMRGHPGDFDAWHAAGATGWTWDALRPFFMRSEKSPFAGEAGYGGDGPMALCQPATPHSLTRCHIAAGAELGLVPIRDHNGPQMAGPTLNTLTIRNGARVSVADAYLTAAVRARENLQILTDVLVDRVLVGPDGRATGVLGRAGADRVLGAGHRAVILAAGTIGSPCILMRSGFGPADDLAALGIPVLRDLPGVGHNLQDHLLCAGNVYRSCQPVPPTTTQHSESLTYIGARNADPAAPPGLVVGVVTVPVLSDGLAGLADAPSPGEGYTLMFGNTHPHSRGRLWLSSADPMVPPIIDPAYLTADEDRTQVLEALGWARRIGSTMAYNAWRHEEVFPRPDDLATEYCRLAFIERAATSHHHPIGTCRMGTDRMAVVQPDLSVPGVPGLYIADGSILPSLTTGPVNAAILAVAERAAVLLAGHCAASLSGPPLSS
jgi:pyridoxine 4-oxidase